MSYPDAFLPMDDYINYDDFASYKKDMVSYDGVGYGVPYDTGRVPCTWRKAERKRTYASDLQPE